MSEVQQGPGWWLASDGKWYPPDQAPPVPAPETWATPPPGPPPTKGLSGGAIAALVAGGVIGLLVLLVVAIGVLGSESEKTFERTGEAITDAGSGEGDDRDTVVVPDGFAVLDGDGVSIAAPAGWELLGPEAMTMSEEEFARAFPDAPPGMAEQASSVFEEGAVLVAFDLGGGSFASNINVIDIPGEAPLSAIEGEAASQLGALGGAVVESGIVDIPVGEALRVVYTLPVAGPGGSSQPAAGAQYYVPRDGRTYVVTISTGTGAGALGDQMIETFRVG